MAEGDGVLYDEFKLRLLDGTYNLTNAAHTIKLALFASGYTPDAAVDTSYTSLSNECTGNNYTVTGETIANQAITKDGANNRAIFDGDDITWIELGTLAPQPAWAVLYDDTTAGKTLIAYWEVNTPTNGGNWTIQFSQSPSAILMIT